MTADSIRAKIPLPKMNKPLIAWAVFILGAIWIYDTYDGSGKQGPWPVSSIFPW